jgi:hypothetical protein
LLGRTVQGIIAGEGTGTAIKIDFSALENEPVRIGSNPIDRLSSAVLHPFELLVLCAWRLDSESGVVCGHLDDNSPGGLMISGVESLRGRVVVDVALSGPGWDLALSFDEQMTLRIFCDQVNQSDLEDNFHFYYPGGATTVGTRSVLRTTTYSETAST